MRIYRLEHWWTRLNFPPGSRQKSSSNIYSQDSRSIAKSKDILIYGKSMTNRGNFGLLRKDRRMEHAWLSCWRFPSSVGPAATTKSGFFTKSFFTVLIYTCQHHPTPAIRLRSPFLPSLVNHLSSHFAQRV